MVGIGMYKFRTFRALEFLTYLANLWVKLEIYAPIIKLNRRLRTISKGLLVLHDSDHGTRYAFTDFFFVGLQGHLRIFMLFLGN